MDNIVKNISTNSVRVFNIFSLTFKSFVKNWKMLIIIFIFPFFILGTNLVLPFYSILGSIINLYTVTLIVTILGVTTRKLRRSTLFRNVKTTGNDKYKFYLSNAIFTFLLTTFIVLIFWTSLCIFGEFGWITMQNFNNYLAPSGVLTQIKFNPLRYWNSIMVILLIFPTSLMSFSLFFIFYSISRNDKEYFIFICVLLITGLIFAGPVNTYLRPSFDSRNGYHMISPTTFAEVMFWPSIILQPLFALGQTFNMLTRSTWDKLLQEYKDGVLYVPTFVQAFNIVFYSGDAYHLKAMAIILQPYISSAIYIFIGVVISGQRKNI